MVRHWVREVLEQAVDHDRPLAPSLFDDLKRIAAVVEEAQPYVFRSPDMERLAEAVADVADIDELSKLAWEIAVVAGFQHVTLFVLRQGDAAPFRRRVCTSFPESWIERFKVCNYQYVDPIVARAATSDRPFRFSEARGDGPIVEAFWADATAHGIGRNGLCFPVDLPGGARIAVSYVTANPAPVAEAAAQRNICDLHVISQMLVDAFGYLTRVSTDVSDSLTPVELRFLHMLMTSDDPEAALRVTPQYGSNRDLQAGIKKKLGVGSIFQAVALASVNRWFDDMPYDTSEVSYASQGLAGWDLVDGDETGETAPGPLLPEPENTPG